MSKLERVVRAHGIRATAKDLHVSHVTVLRWLSGRLGIRPARREQIISFFWPKLRAADLEPSRIRRGRHPNSRREYCPVKRRFKKGASRA